MKFILLLLVLIGSGNCLSKSQLKMKFHSKAHSHHKSNNSFDDESELSYQNSSSESLSYNYQPDPPKKTVKAQINSIPSNFKSVKVVEHIPKGLYESTSKDQAVHTEAEAEADLGDMNYYDGKSKLVQDNNCGMYSGSPIECMKVAHCGYCEDNNNCIPGDKNGPAFSCAKFRYLF